MNFVEGQPFARFISENCPPPVPPKVWEVRAALLSQAHQLCESITPESQGGMYCSLMIDGVTAADWSWIGVCLGSFKGITFLRVLTVVDQAAATIALQLLEVVHNLQARRFILVAIVTDNASNEIAAIRELGDQAALAAENVLVFRIPCLSHTANLAVQDALEQFFHNREIFKDMTCLRKAVKKTIGKERAKRFPEACRTRWLSLGKLICEFVALHGLIERSLMTDDNQKRDAVRRIWRAYDFE
jgi:hypothetical protein